jgi:hypothetical protein
MTETTKLHGFTVEELPSPAEEQAAKLELAASAEEESIAGLNALADVWKPASALGPWFSDTPPERDWLLRRDDRGVLPLGKVGMIAAPGGAGKSWAVTQLALAVATGFDWLGFEVASPGSVLLVLGEEEADEARRRLFYAAAAMRLDTKDREVAASRLWVLPMAGRPVALTRELERVEGDALPLTPMADELEHRLKTTVPPEPWRLVVFDPLSRFAGGDVEKDNAAATRFVQVLERMAHLGPTVLVTHHTNKVTRAEDPAGRKTEAAATIAARGASGLTDGVRWVATLTGRARIEGAPRLSELVVTKSNYARTPDPVTLVADEDANGTLRVAEVDEVSHYEAAAAAKEPPTTTRPSPPASGRRAGASATARSVPREFEAGPDYAREL